MLFELCEPLRTVKRWLDGYIPSRRAYAIILIALGLVLYLGPSIFHWLRQKAPTIIDSGAECLEAQMHKIVQESLKYDATVYSSNDRRSNGFLPYVGNGKIALSIKDNKLYIHHKRSLSLLLDYEPVVFLDIPSRQDGLAVHFTNGIGYKFQCYSLPSAWLSVTHHFYAYRAIPSLLVQEIEIINPQMTDINIHLKRTSTKYSSISINTNQQEFQYQLYSGSVVVPETADIIVFAIASPVLTSSVVIKAKSSTVIPIRTIIHYSNPAHESHHLDIKKRMEDLVRQDLKKILDFSMSDIRKKHTEIWKQTWHSGFGISISRAQGALNGDKINATLYYVLSNVREYMSEFETSSQYQLALQKYLYSPDKCYGGHHTLQASTLWSELKTIKHVNDVVSLWLLTLSKQGCQNLMRAGASGVMQSMVLSFGGFKFTNHHLEFDCDPKDLHRDYHFRRIIYGNSTHINISVVVQEDNKAVIYGALDRSDKDYYACDAGCLDIPSKLGSKPVQFPVKITNPLTAVLYVTPDKVHMEELKHTLHVREVIEAPAHEHHIIALHKHGHKLGGLPAFFWVSIAFLIAVFHLFLIKLIYNEYCGNQEKTRKRYLV